MIFIVELIIIMTHDSNTWQYHMIIIHDNYYDYYFYHTQSQINGFIVLLDY